MHRSFRSKIRGLPRSLPPSLALLLFLLPALRADVALHPLFSDYAVLQRDHPVPVWGTANAGEAVTVAFAGQTVSALADARGRWLVRLAPVSATSKPQALVVRATNTVAVRDVVVGEVWLAAGQSNMASPLSSGSAAEALPSATDPLLRFFTVTKAISAEPLADVQGSWEPSTPESARKFSAVAYFFARELRLTQNIPVAVINASWGGTPIQTWMSLESLRREPPITRILADWNKAHVQHLAVKDHPQRMVAYLEDMKAWETDVMPAFKQAQRAHPETVEAAKAAGRPVPPSPKPARPEPVAPDPIAMPAPSKRPNTPTITYNAMIAPLVPYALRGVLWYQGEADASRGLDYRVSFPRLIEGWRSAWGQGDFPFLYVQLPANGRDPVPVAPSGLPFLREAQLLTLGVSNTAMAVTVDIGDPADVHPDNKVHVGHRLALLARRMVHGEHLVSSGPIYAGSSLEGGTFRIRFSDTGGGLEIGQAPWVARGVQPLPTDRLQGFYIAGEDRIWVAADARIDGETVLVSSPAVTQPKAVRYGWAHSPRINLSNRAGLPAAPFRTDDWN